MSDQSARRLRTQAERDTDGAAWRNIAARVEPLTLPGHDRGCALAMLNQARMRGGIDEVQVEHLLAIGYRAGVESGLRRASERPPADRSWIEMECAPPRRRWWHRYTRRNP